MKFLLDTGSVSYAIRGEGRVAEQIQAHRPSELGVSSITLAELRFGAERRKSRRLHRLIDGFIGDIDVALFDAEAAGRFGKIGASLASKGTPIGTLDTMIAAHALHLDLILVTHNEKHFRRVRGLKIADWW